MDPLVFEMRAQSFFASMNDLVVLGRRDDGSILPTYHYAIALLAVHAAISFSDLLLVLATGRTTNGLHEKAPKELEKAMKSRRIECKAISKFKRLLSGKHHIAYGSRLLAPAEVKDAVMHAQSFAAWSLEAAAKLREET